MPRDWPSDSWKTGLKRGTPQRTFVSSEALGFGAVWSSALNFRPSHGEHPELQITPVKPGLHCACMIAMPFERLTGLLVLPDRQGGWLLPVLIK